MQNNSLILNNIFLEEIIRAKLLDTHDNSANTSKLNEQVGFDKYTKNYNTEVRPIAALGLKYDSKQAKFIRLQVKAATELQKQLNATTASGLLDSPAEQKKYMSYMRPKAVYDKLKDKSSYFLPWKNTAADSFFKNIVKNSTGAMTGVYENHTNPDKQWYSYQILMIAVSGKTRCVVQFHPDGTCNISDEGPLSVSKWNYSIKGGKLYITQPDIDKWIMKCTPSAYYLVAEFNPELNNKVFDPYKGAGFWKSAWLDLTGYRKENYWATKKDPQKSYEESSDAFWDVVQTIGDWAGLIPGYGDIIDIANAIGYFSRGKKFEGCLSLIAIVPVVGSVIKLGVKNGVKALRVGNRVGCEAIDAIIANPTLGSILLDYLRRNKAARDAFKAFIKNAHKASAWRPIVTAVINVLRWIPGAKMVSEALNVMLRDYGTAFDNYFRGSILKLDQLIQTLDVGSDAAKLGAKAERETAEKLATDNAAAAVETGKLFGRPLRKRLIQDLGSTILNGAGRLNKFLEKIVGKEFWDALSRSMSNNFVKFASNLPLKEFIGLIKASPGGIALFVRSLKTYDETIIRYFIDNRILPGIILPGARLSENWRALTAHIGRATDRELRDVMRHIRGSMAGMPERITDLNYRVITSLISEGNAFYKVWCMKFWNIIRGAAPWAIYKWAKDGKYISFVKYGTQPNLLTKSFTPIYKAIDTWLAAIPIAGPIIAAPIKLLLKALDGLTNLKRLDIIWNELQDFFENTTGKDLSVNEKQSVILSTFAYFIGNAPYDLINYLIKIVGGVLPKGVVPVNRPTEIPMVKNQGFAKKLNDK